PTARQLAIESQEVRRHGAPGGHRPLHRRTPDPRRGPGAHRDRVDRGRLLRRGSDRTSPEVQVVSNDPLARTWPAELANQSFSRLGSPTGSSDAHATRVDTLMYTWY